MRAERINYSSVFYKGSSYELFIIFFVFIFGYLLLPVVLVLAGLFWGLMASGLFLIVVIVVDKGFPPYDILIIKNGVLKICYVYFGIKFTVLEIGFDSVEVVDNYKLLFFNNAKTVALTDTNWDTDAITFTKIKQRKNKTVDLGNKEDTYQRYQELLNYVQGI